MTSARISVSGATLAEAEQDARKHLNEFFGGRPYLLSLEAEHTHTVLRWRVVADAVLIEADQ